MMEDMGVGETALEMSAECVDTVIPDVLSEYLRNRPECLRESITRQKRQIPHLFLAPK